MAKYGSRFSTLPKYGSQLQSNSHRRDRRGSSCVGRQPAVAWPARGTPAHFLHIIPKLPLIYNIFLNIMNAENEHRNGRLALLPRELSLARPLQPTASTSHRSETVPRKRNHGQTRPTNHQQREIACELTKDSMMRVCAISAFSPLTGCVQTSGWIDCLLEPFQPSGLLNVLRPISF